MCPVNDRVKIQIFLCHVSSSAQQRLLLLSYAVCSRAVQQPSSSRRIHLGRDLCVLFLSGEHFL